MANAPMPAELVDLVSRVARYHHGLAFLHQGYADNVALTLGVHPFTVDAARLWLATHEGRAEMIAAVKAVSPELPAGTGPLAGSDDDPGAPGPEVVALLRSAQSRTAGVPFLASGPLADVAAAFGAHPYAVCRARIELERRGVTG